MECWKDGIHATICEKLTGILDEGPNPGNNVLPAVPEMRHILNSPELRCVHMFLTRIAIATIGPLLRSVE